MWAEMLFIVSSVAFLFFYTVLWVERKRGKKFVPQLRELLDKQSIKLLKKVQTTLIESPNKFKKHCIRRYVNLTLRKILKFVATMAAKIQKVSISGLEKLDKQEPSGHLQEMHKRKKELNSAI